ncbi:LuxR C-terminal-related transcriptional regulator [Solirubrobacter phytolaccae]|uniref:LuxR C-terminal-related transcriptional regulator n=1 Tax=Solirubrobacter phytolaccae TaxID=1404360 RepID=A0A9X3N7V4_9ACTN|nr:LuxR C-terminal-related transcriptional regulator [Solirubrobacter phytolaccae]MDA0181358.1 LuxR C-terminal-related transcriptional regulator [Solirubrobacter phytolaccae]
MSASTLTLVEPLALPAAGLPASAVPRTRLVRQLTTTDAPIVLVVAPAGYGKTTLLEEWAARDPRPFTWLACPGDHAVDAVQRRLEGVIRSPAAQVVVVDDTRLTSPARTQALLNTACRLPRGSRLVLASRARPPGALGRLRARRLLLELGAPELALTPLEAARLVETAGLRLDRHRLGRLLARTGGWPVMVDLATAAVAGATDQDAAIMAFGGADRAVAELLRDEVLAPLTPVERAFVRRTSIIGRLTAGACDAVLDGHGSGATLERLARSGVPIEPLDRTDLAFRWNPLLAQMLRAELCVHEPERVGVLHRRAARWFTREREPSLAIRHAVACGDTRLAGRIAWAHAPRLAANGRVEPLGEWLGAVRGSAVSDDAGLALTATVHHLLTGRRRAACAAVAVAEHRLQTDRLAGGHAAVALLRACLAPSGLAAAAQDAAHARALLPADSPWHALALLILGIAAHLDGDVEGAVVCLDEAAGRATGHVATVAATAHAQLALVAAEIEDWDEAAHHALEARTTLPPTGPEAIHAFVAATSAVVAAHRGEIAQARHDAGEADRLLASRADFPPWLVCEAHVWLARAAIRLSDGPTARRLLARAARLAPTGGEADGFSRWIHDGWERADAFAESATGDGPALTNAELRILRLLPSHLSFREIGERLHVSTNTVKTQALAVYRKLDVSCRSDAVERGRQAGLVGDT